MTQAAGGPESPAEAPGGGPDAGQPSAQGTAQPKVTEYTARREAVGRVSQEFGVNERRACTVVGVWRSTMRYQNMRSELPSRSQ